MEVKFFIFVFLTLCFCETSLVFSKETLKLDCLNKITEKLKNANQDTTNFQKRSVQSSSVGGYFYSNKPPRAYLPPAPHEPLFPPTSKCSNGAPDYAYPDCCVNGGKGEYCCTNGYNNPNCAPPPPPPTR